MRTIAAVTVGRSDYGIYKPVFRHIAQTSGLSLRLLVSGTHLSPEFGMTVKEIEADGFPIEERIEMLMSSDSAQGIARSIGNGVSGFAQTFSRFRPDICLVLGDRFEMLAAAVAAMSFNIPLAHLHGGESTEGLIDEAIRHCLTKMSHVHFVATETYANRVRSLGEEAWRIVVSGAPALDALEGFRPIPSVELSRQIGVPLSEPILVVTFHPVTLHYERSEGHLEELLAALEAVGLPCIFTQSNADTTGRALNVRLRDFVRRTDQMYMVDNLGIERYFSLLSIAAAVVGNSSSGIIEAASFRIPVVNIGDRQKGRLKPRNVIDTVCERVAVETAIRRALSPEFRDSLSTMRNPYMTGHASEVIVRTLEELPIDARLLEKHLVER